MHALFPLLAFMKSDCYNNRSIWKLQELYFIPTITGDYNNEEKNHLVMFANILSLVTLIIFIYLEVTSND